MLEVHVINLKIDPGVYKHWMFETWQRDFCTNSLICEK